jgi:hypothetical protein
MQIKNGVIITLLIIYYLFTSGFIYEVIQKVPNGAADIPYSIGLSGERTGLGGILTQDDLNCLEWINSNHLVLPMGLTGDYNSYIIFSSYSTIQFDHYLNYRWGLMTSIPDDCYIFIYSWSAKHNKYIESSGVGTRVQMDLPEIKQPIGFQSGNAKVYVKQTPKPGG